MTLTSPIRNPDLRNPSVMTRRAWWLIVLSLIIPGSAQLLAGNRRLGRILFGSWLSMVAIVIIGFALNSFVPAFALTIATSWWGLLALQIGLVYVALVWFVGAVDTFRLLRFVYVGQRAKAWVAFAVIVSILVPAGAASYASFLTGVSRSTLADIFANQADIVEPIDGVYTFLLIGGDAGKHRISRRTDSMSFATVDATTGQVTIVGLPRNLYNAPFVKGSPMLRDWPNGFNCGDDCLLAYVYTYALDHPELYPGVGANSDPGVEALRDSVEEIVGMPVQFYVGVDMASFQDLVDEAKRWVQQRCPEWTDHNVSDPGVTLIETFAYMADLRNFAAWDPGVRGGVPRAPPRRWLPRSRPASPARCGRRPRRSGRWEAGSRHRRGCRRT